MKKRTKLVLLLGMVVIVSVLGLGMVLLHRQLANQVSFAFLGAPTVSAGGMATFTITNRSNLDIDYVVCPIQVKLNGSWSSLQFPSNGAAGTRLSRGKGGTLTVAPPAHAEAWRVPVFWVRMPTHTQLWMKRAQQWISHLGDPSASVTGFALATQTNVSPEVVSKP